MAKSSVRIREPHETFSFLNRLRILRKQKISSVSSSSHSTSSFRVDLSLLSLLSFLPSRDPSLFFCVLSRASGMRCAFAIPVATGECLVKCLRFRLSRLLSSELRHPGSFAFVNVNVNCSFCCLVISGKTVTPANVDRLSEAREARLSFLVIRIIIIYSLVRMCIRIRWEICCPRTKR